MYSIEILTKKFLDTNSQIQFIYIQNVNISQNEQLSFTL